MKDTELLQRVIAKWEAFCYNYRSTTSNGITYPIALDQINWANGDNAYMRDKWVEVCDKYNCQGSEAMHLFFGELDEDNQQALVEFAFSR